VRPGLVQEIGAAAAVELVRQGRAQWLDCRYDLEFEESRLPGARLLPLDSLREEAHRLDPETTYVVYCRSGQRSLAAAFLLRERNIYALSLAGGIRDWPYEVDARPLDVAG
jgi:rhodanese-related sulfurtransferase